MGRPEEFSLDHGIQSNYQTEAQIYAKQFLKTKPDAKIGVLYQNDGFGKDYLIGLKDGLGDDHAAMIIKEVSYETSEPTIDSQVVTLKDSGADIFHRRDAEIRRPGDPQVLRHRLEGGALSDQRLAFDRDRAEAGRPRKIERPHHRLLRQGSDRRALEGRCRLQGMCGVHRQISDADRSGRRQRRLWFRRGGDMVQVLKQCGNDLSRENIMKQAANVKDLELPMLLPGIEDQHVADQFLADPADAACVVQWRKLDSCSASCCRDTRARAPVRAPPQATSNSPAAPMPPPTHIVTTTYRRRAACLRSAHGR